MRKKYKNFIDTPENEVEKAEFDKIYEKYKEMFKTDVVFIGVIARKLFGKNKKKRGRFGDYMMDLTLLDVYQERKEGPAVEYLK